MGAANEIVPGEDNGNLAGRDGRAGVGCYSQWALAAAQTISIRRSYNSWRVATGADTMCIPFSYPNPMINSRCSLGLLPLLCLALPVAALAQTSVSINAGAVIRTVDERVFGVNAVMWDGLTSTTQTISLLQAADIRAIRLPGGSLSDEYHWRTNTTLANTWTWASAFNSGAALITGLNAQVVRVMEPGFFYLRIPDPGTDAGTLDSIEIKVKTFSFVHRAAFVLIEAATRTSGARFPND